MAAKKRHAKSPSASTTSSRSIAHRLSGARVGVAMTKTLKRARALSNTIASRLGDGAKTKTTTSTPARSSVIARLGDASIASRLGDAPRRAHAATKQRKNGDSDLRARLATKKTSASASKKNKNKNKNATVAPAIRKMLVELDLQRFLPTFAREEVDVRALKVMKESDYKAMDIPLGPAAKLRDAARKIR